ncbi:WPE palindromic element domain-containing protein [Wolbachia pipientis]
MNICLEGSALNVIADFASNTKVSFQCLTLESSLNATTLKPLCFNIRLATFIFTNLMSNQNSWIPVPRHWDDILLVYNIRTVVYMTQGSITLLFWIPVSATCMTPLLMCHSC